MNGCGAIIQAFTRCFLYSVLIKSTQEELWGIYLPTTYQKSCSASDLHLLQLHGTLSDMLTRLY